MSTESVADRVSADRLVLRVQLETGWLPLAREKSDPAPIEDTIALLERDLVFRRTPVAGEYIRIDGEFHKAVSFFHDLDHDCLRVCLQPEHRHTPADGQKRIAELKARGWEVAHARQPA